ncbi:MAG: M48 family metallopeptidase [Proteobacteria bacterium]|nr:MAG: M48 family metallopeptidase [Pseudomonadota bacterium]
MNEGEFLSGSFTDGQRAVDYPCHVQISASELILFIESSDSSPRRWAKDSVHIDSSFPGLLKFSSQSHPGETLFLKRPIVDTYLLAHEWRRPSESGAHSIWIFGCVLAVLLSLIYISIDPLSRAIAARIPASAEAKLGSTMIASFESKQCKNNGAQMAIEKLAGRVMTKEEAGSVRILIVQDESVNAFALPGKIVIVNYGLIKKALHPDEVAGVLAHELEHLSQRHVMNTLTRSLLLSAIWTLVLGDVSGFLIVDPDTAFRLVNIKFGRDQELQADAGGLGRMLRGNVDPMALAHFFTSLEKSNPSKIPEFLSSHPKSTSRADKAKKASFKGSWRPVLDAQEWKVLREGC